MTRDDAIKLMLPFAIEQTEFSLLKTKDLAVQTAKAFTMLTDEKWIIVPIRNITGWYICRSGQRRQERESF